MLLVDSVDQIRLVTKWFLSYLGYSVDMARTAEEALTRFDPTVHDIVVTENSMPGMTGLDMAHIVKLRSPFTPVLMYAPQPPDDTACLDVVIQRPTHLLQLAKAIDERVRRGPTAGA